MPDDGTRVETDGDGATGGSQPLQLQTPFGPFAFTFTDEEGTVHEGAAAIQRTLEALGKSGASGCSGIGCGCGDAASESPPADS